MIRSAHDELPSQAITEDFREAITKILELADDTVAIYADRIESRCGKANVVAEAESETPEKGVSLWGAKQITPALAIANSWSPSKWPRAPFRGDVVSGFVSGKRG
jgi:hypothetical protein